MWHTAEHSQVSETTLNMKLILIHELKPKGLLFQP